MTSIDKQKLKEELIVERKYHAKKVQMTLEQGLGIDRDTAIKEAVNFSQGKVFLKSIDMTDEKWETLESLCCDTGVFKLFRAMAKKPFLKVEYGVHTFIVFYDGEVENIEIGGVETKLDTRKREVWEINYVDRVANLPESLETKMFSDLDSYIADNNL
ncbi:MAG: hypothetical protein ACXADW_23905 [Candidatus Hodarchaeales archaeon]|jgi:hypothetical protein